MDSTIYEVEEDSIENSNFTLVEEMPEFSGGQMALHKIIAQTIKYPVYAQEHGIQGKVFVRFVINENGSISNARIAKGVHPMLDAEAIRVVRSMPKWKPGRQEGKAVKVSYTVPINFVLR
jgi:protein TonB